MSNLGYSGSSYDRYVENTNTSTLHKMKETYWTTKQAVIKKLGKKEDEHVVASDSQLDSKLEVFKAIQRSSMELLRVIEKYQDRLCVVSQEENTMGRLLKAHSNKDKTRAGKMMAAVGKAESNSAQERLALHNPLRRLYQEVETFRYRAVSDTLVTINRMESARTEYRGALLWMKNVSDELNPDMYKQLEKFRKVQSQVRKTKTRFDKLKLDVMQKIDLLAASRCNMFSHVLANYQTMLLHYWDKTSRTMTAVADSFKGYQYYEFNMLRELTETSKKLAQESKEERDEDGNIIEDSSPRSKSSSKSPKHRHHRRHGSKSSSRRASSGDGGSLGNSPFSSPASNRSESSRGPESPWMRKKKDDDSLNSEYWKKVSGLADISGKPGGGGSESLKTNSSVGSFSTTDDLLQMGGEEVDSAEKAARDAAERATGVDRASTSTIYSYDQVEPSPQLARRTQGDAAIDDSLISVSEGQDARDSAKFDENLLADLRLNSGNQDRPAKAGNGTEDSDFGPFMDFTDDDTLLGVDDDDQDFAGKIREAAAANKAVQHAEGKKDLLADDLLASPGDGPGISDDAGKDDMELLNEILSVTGGSGGGGGDDEFAQEWDSVFGTSSTPSGAGGVSGHSATADNILGGTTPAAGGDDASTVGAADGLSGSMSSLSSSSLTSGGGQKKAPEFLPSALLDTRMAEGDLTGSGAVAADKKKSKPQNLTKGAAPPTTDMSAWFNLFADLDPLSNPDAIGRKPADMTDA